MSNKLRVLVVSQHFWPETFRINEVVETLRAFDVEVDVLAGQPNYPEGKTFEGYRAFSWSTELHPAGYQIHRVPVVPRGKGGGFRRIANYISFVVSAAVIGPWLVRGASYDVIFVYAISPILQGLPAAFLKLTKGAPLVVWVQDLWPDSLESTGYINNKIALAAVAKITRFIYNRADLLLTQSMGFVGEIRKLAGDHVPIIYHPNPGDIALANQRVLEASTLKMQPGFNIIFAGNLGSAQALETILDAAAHVASDPEIRFVLVGDGSRLRWLREEIVQRNLQNVESVGRFPIEAMPAIFAAASALLVTLNRARNLSITIPSKISSYLAAAKPMLASMDGEGAEIVQEAGAGFAVPAEDAWALAGAIIRLKSMSVPERDAMGASGRAYFDKHFAPCPLAQKLIEHFLHVINTRRKITAAKVSNP